MKSSGPACVWCGSQALLDAIHGRWGSWHDGCASDAVHAYMMHGLARSPGRAPLSTACCGKCSKRLHPEEWALSVDGVGSVCERCTLTSLDAVARGSSKAVRRHG